ncbi:hypothetical protein [Sporomusa ovata]|uniref:Uncharacterized protein n=1 Tax=Sporomusa ovata TaxID=2378 RepID=A0A0U1L339_9FIRM|nr:hypothetical protein [Sporomusa ovata]CQR73334.1 hypothetical protein SpAn4DRAFT_2566 [Sporomusa ovata]
MCNEYDSGKSQGEECPYDRLQRCCKECQANDACVMSCECADEVGTPVKG